MTSLRPLLLALFFILSNSAFAGVQGTLRVVKGDVQVISGGATSRARLGMQIQPHDVILTGKDARAKVVMSDGNELNVSPESRLEIQNYEFDPKAGKKEVLLNVIYGKVRSKVEQHYDGKTSHFNVKTPAAVAGVRGTDFITSFDQNTKSSSVVTFRGAVEFGLPGVGGAIMNSVSVTPGKMASSVSGAAPMAPVTIPKAQFDKMEHDSHADQAKNAVPQKDGGRSLASVGSAGMMRPEDLPASNGGVVAAPTPSSPPPPQIVQAPPQPPPPSNLIQSLIQNKGSAKLNVHIK